MPVLSPAQLQSLSDLAVGLAFDKLCDIQDEVLTPDQQYGAGPSYTTIASNVPCCVVADTAAPTEKPIAGVVATEAKKKFFFPRGTVLKENNRLLIDSKKYHIIGVSTGVSFEVLPMATVREEFSA